MKWRRWTISHLGANVSKDGGSTADARKRIDQASTAFNRLANVWQSKDIGRKTKSTLQKPSIAKTANISDEAEFDWTYPEERRLW